jgi:hypothetical protein
VAVRAEQAQVFKSVVRIETVDMVQVQCDRPSPPFGDTAFRADGVQQSCAQQPQSKCVAVGVRTLLYKDLGKRAADVRRFAVTFPAEVGKIQPEPFCVLPELFVIPACLCQSQPSEHFPN